MTRSQAAVLGVLFMVACLPRTTVLGQLPDGGTGGGSTALGGGAQTGGGSVGGGTSMTGGGDEVPTPCTAFMGELCAFYSRCFSIDAGQCVAGTASYCDRVNESVLHGALTYDVDQLTRCRAEVAADQTCDLDALANCSDYFVGAAPPGGQCGTSLDCATSLISIPFYGGLQADPAGYVCGNDGTCPAVCTTRGTVGTACLDVDEGNGKACAVGLWCNDATQLCETPLDAGTACGSVSTDSETSPCGPDGTCDQGSSLCTPLGAVGNGCGDCGPGLTCGNGALCVARQQLGQSCIDAICLEGLVCGPDGLCQTPRIRNVGESCDTVDECLVALTIPPTGGCDAALHTCVAYSHPAAAGEPCGTLEHCNGLACHGIAMLDDGGYSAGACGESSLGETCVVVRIGIGEPLGFLQCSAGLRCSPPDGGVGPLLGFSPGTCEVASAGGPCTSPQDCDPSETCSTDFEVAGTCIPRTALGATCHGIDPCAAGLYCGAALDGGLPACIQPASFGQPCAATTEAAHQCVDGLICGSAQTCVLGGMPGGPCLAGNLCLYGACVVQGSNATCSAPGTGACASDAACVSGRCRNNTCAPAACF